MEHGKKAVLVVSFGTSYEETRKKTIDQIEETLRRAYPEHIFYRAWTSKMIRKKLLERDGVRVFDVTEAMEDMEKNGITEVLVQPTHVINGIENDQMLEDLSRFRDCFSRISIGTPLLTSAKDSRRVIKAVTQELQPASDEALVFMGHGTEHYVDAIYAALDYQFKDMGHDNIFMGTVEGYPTLDSVRKLVEKAGFKKVVLAPFMIVAGDHALNDLSGEEEDSWKRVFEREGYEVRCILKGLGEYPAIRDIFLDHARDAIDNG